MTRNSKHEIRNKFKYQMTKTSLRAPLKRLKVASVLDFEFWSFEFVSNFDIRISDFDAPLGVY